MSEEVCLCFHRLAVHDSYGCATCNTGACTIFRPIQSKGPKKTALPTRPRTLETDLVKLFIARVPFVIPNARAFKRAIVDDMSIRGHRILAGIEGQADVYVYLRGGRVVEVEAKMAKGRMRDAQLAWAALCKAFEIPHMVVRALAGEEATVTVDRWVEELRRVIG